jgi:predicted metal-dependent phosphoesterase TrpH
MIRIDLHTHSEASIDGGLSPENYADILREEKLDVIAITDHDRIDFAQGLQKALGEDRIIVGQEISTTDGDIVGLYLKEKIEPGLTAQKAIDAVKSQDGLVYIPHPYEKVRHGIKKDVLLEIIDKVDIIEAHNGRSMSKKTGVELETLGIKNDIAICGSSDAHGKRGIGYTYTTIDSKPTRKTLAGLLKNGTIVAKRPQLISYLNPKYNRLKNYIKGYN